MKKFSLFIIALLIFCISSISQSKSKPSGNSDTVAEYIPIEGKSEGVPVALQGTWVLISGVDKMSQNQMANIKKPVAGTETRDSVTTTTTVNGETRTVTEVQIDRIATPVNQITPPQKDRMHKAAKPSISFYGLNETFSGFTGCNKYSGRYKLSGNKIVLLDGAASTKMVCMGDYDESAFLNSLKRVNAYRSNNGQLELLDGNDIVLVFGRK